MGYVTKNIIENLGSMFIYLVGYFALAIFTLILKVFKGSCKL